jgi:hypothetical protein
VEAEPDCQGKQGAIERITEPGLQTLDVAQGLHTVQTEISFKKPIAEGWKGKLYTWAIVYTMYDH